MFRAFFVYLLHKAFFFLFVYLFGGCGDYNHYSDFFDNSSQKREILSFEKTILLNILSLDEVTRTAGQQFGLKDEDFYGQRKNSD